MKTDFQGPLLNFSTASYTTRHHYDAAGNPVRTDYPDGSHETFEYDRLNRLTAHIDGLGAKTAYELAVDGLPLKRTNALGHTRLSGSQIRRLEAGGRFPNGWPTTCKPKAKTHTMP